MATGTAVAVAEIDAAALHMVRTYGQEDTPAERKRWAGRIRLWAHRYPQEITDHGRTGRRRRYDLEELQRVADRVLGTPDAARL